MSSQSIQDRIIAAKHSIAGQGLAKVVCKATTEEVMGPKKKHLDCKLRPIIVSYEKFLFGFRISTTGSTDCAGKNWHFSSTNSN